MRESECPSEQESRIEWWRRLISRQQSASVPLTQFCRQAGVRPRKFYYWRKRLREMDAASSRRQVGPSGSSRSASPMAEGSGDTIPNFSPRTCARPKMRITAALDI